MQLCIHAHGIDLTESIKRQTYQKLELALDQLEEQIRIISVCLTNKQCHSWLAPIEQSQC